MPTTLSSPTLARPLLLALDIGSSSVRALLYDGRGRAVADVGVREAYAMHATADGAVVDDPDGAVERVARCVDGVLAQLGPRAGEIGAVAVATLASSFVAVDGAGRALTPLISYADTRSAPDAARLREALDERATHERTGALLRASYWPARLAWLRRTQPELWAQRPRWMTLGEYVEFKLFGARRVSLSIASWGGLLDRRRLVWDGPLLAHLGVEPGQLAPLVDRDEPLSGLAPLYATRWPALRDAPWFPAIGDGAAANIGSGCLGPDRAALTIGTTGAMRLVQPGVAALPPGLWCYRVDRERALLGGATSEGGNVYAWLRQTLGSLGSESEIEAAVAAYPPDGHGLTVLPFLAGERSPGWAGDARATFHGVSLATTPLALLRASLESVAYRFALIDQRLTAGASQPPRLIASGSALARSPAWMQIFADVLGRPVVASAEPETTSRGAALLALEALGAIPSLGAAPAAEGATYEPDGERHAIYREAIARQEWLYERLVGRR